MGGYNDKYAIPVKMGEITVKPCQELFSVFFAE
jgi:hypothetical protein